MKIWIIFIAICGISCKQEPRVERKVEIIGRDTFKVVKIRYQNSNLESVLRYKNDVLHGESETYYENGNMKQQKTYFEDHEYGNFIKYSPYGALLSYGFLLDSIHSPYILSFGENGKIEEIEGDPFVDYTTSYNSSRDTLALGFLFTDFFTKRIKVEISEDGKQFSSLHLRKSDKFQNLRVGDYRKATRDLKDLTFFFKMHVLYENQMNKIFYDSLFLEKR